MEDTKSLLMMVLHKIFQNQPKTIENMFQLIHNFNNGKIDKTNYEKILKTICDLMNDELPSPILVYVLTLVDMPQDFDSQSPIIEKMRRTHDFLPEINVRPYLLEYLNNIKLTNNTKNRSDTIEVMEKKNTESVVTENTCSKSKDEAVNFVKPTKVLKRSKKILPKVKSPKSLLDISADYVVKNENMLKMMYKKKQASVWGLINEESLPEPALKQCYDVVKELNKKMKWLRAIESENISSDILLEEYNASDIFFKENNVFRQLNYDPFESSRKCEEAIDHSFF